MSRFVPQPLKEPAIRVLTSLFEHGGLTTSLLRQYIIPDVAVPNAVLTRLYTLGLVSRMLGYNGVTRESCWFLRVDGARQLNKVPQRGHAIYKLPTPLQLLQKESVLHLVQYFRSMDWCYLQPQLYNSAKPKPAETPQYQALYRVIEQQFNSKAATPTRPCLHPSHIPPGLNDWVAWPQQHPNRPIILILHPPGGTPEFWNRPVQRFKAPTTLGTSKARIQLYADLIDRIPVLALFHDSAPLEFHRSLLEANGIHCYTAETLTDFFINPVE